MIVYILCNILNVYHEHTWLEHKIIRANVTVQQQNYHSQTRYTCRSSANYYPNIFHIPVSTSYCE